MPEADQQQNPFLTLIQQLMGRAQPRPDLITPGSTGALENARPATFAGRVTTGGETPQQIMQRMPMGELESAGRIPTATQDLMGLMSLAKGIPAAVAFHGSPYKFDKFDLSKIGTGEGAQTFGHGLYFAENPETAEFYKNTLSHYQKPRVSIDGNPVEPKSIAEKYALGRVQDKLTRTNDVQKAIDETIRDARNLRGANEPGYVAQEKAIADYLEKLKGQKIGKINPGALYKVDIKDEHVSKMLDWDKPLSKQPENVQTALRPLLEKQKAELGEYWPKSVWRTIDDMPGSDIYSGLAKSEGSNPENATQYLHSLGIPGIKYLDQFSREAGKGTFNYVVFDPSSLKSVERMK